jgi:hypothetical protein
MAGVERLAASGTARIRVLASVCDARTSREELTVQPMPRFAVHIQATGTRHAPLGRKLNGSARAACIEEQQEQGSSDELS